MKILLNMNDMQNYRRLRYNSNTTVRLLLQDDRKIDMQLFKIPHFPYIDIHFYTENVVEHQKTIPSNTTTRRIGSM